jgi:TolB-like protein
MTELPDARGERLESWKRIAVYLKRDVRTVQRWEEANGLPIHRHQRAQRPIPYAYTKELDAWWTRHPDHVEVAAPKSRRRLLIIATAASLVALIGALVLFGISGHGASPPAKSVAVRAFVDLSEGMANEEFADGMTEEVISRLNKISGLRVQVVATGSSQSLRVAWLLDGSVRRSGERVRVVARLVSAKTNDVVWSESYDRTSNDVLSVQDDIANKVAQALEGSITGR